MAMFDIKGLVILLISIDIFAIIACIYLIGKIRSMPKAERFEEGIKLFESLLNDAGQISGCFTEQVTAKYDMIKKINAQLDKRIDSINVLLNRANIILSDTEKKYDQSNQDTKSILLKQKEIIKLDSQGCDVEEIANRLLVPKGEVKLILDLNKNLPGLK
ncbi:MAG: hypothetical protein KKC46_03470 [Proteobacteria bacterium]|nr:hypothetical protein [Pseudomonadota bacterium]